MKKMKVKHTEADSCFWAVTPYILVGGYKHYRQMYHLHLQGTPKLYGFTAQMTTAIRASNLRQRSI
jgi:hypothetical protein